MPETPGPCGCRVYEHDRGGGGTYMEIEYCPTHAAAPALLAWVEREDHDPICAVSRPEESLSDDCTCGLSALLAKAKGTADDA